jgi:putative NADPH-quinone reductase
MHQEYSNMHALIVVAHPDPDSLSHGVAACGVDGVSPSGHDNAFEIGRNLFNAGRCDMAAAA